MRYEPCGNKILPHAGENGGKMWEDSQKVNAGKVIVAIIEYGFFLLVLVKVLDIIGLGRY